MCGRYSNKAEGRKLAVRYQAANKNFSFVPNQDIAPTQMSPVVVLEKKQRILKTMKWGLIPSWSKDMKIGVKCFNARAETAQEKPAFRSSFKARRCLVPADAFFEWQARAGKSKLKYCIRVRGQEIFSLAGLWAEWIPPQGDPVLSFTVLTTEANETLAPIHQRMPVILQPDQEQIWLNPDFTNPVLLQGLMKPLPAHRVEASPTETDGNTDFIRPNFLTLIE